MYEQNDVMTVWIFCRIPQCSPCFFDDYTFTNAYRSPAALSRTTFRRFASPAPHTPPLGGATRTMVSLTHFLTLYGFCHLFRLLILTNQQKSPKIIPWSNLRVFRKRRWVRVLSNFSVHKRIEVNSTTLKSRHQWNACQRFFFFFVKHKKYIIFSNSMRAK